MKLLFVLGCCRSEMAHRQLRVFQFPPPGKTFSFCQLVHKDPDSLLHPLPGTSNFETDTTRLTYPDFTLASKASARTTDTDCNDSITYVDTRFPPFPRELGRGAPLKSYHPGVD